MQVAQQQQQQNRGWQQECRRQLRVCLLTLQHLMMQLGLGWWEVQVQLMKQ
jgi:hypothetical protein